MSHDPDETEPLDLRGLLDRLPDLEVGDLMVIVAAYEAADPSEREATRRTAVQVAGKAGRGDEVDRLQGSILQWAGSDLRVNDGYPTLRLGDRLLRDARVQAAPALVDAAIALLLDGALGSDARERLLEPVAASIG